MGSEGEKSGLCASDFALLLSARPFLWTMSPEALARLEGLEVLILAC